MDDGRTALQFEDLVVFRRAYRLSLEVHRASLGWPEREQRGLGEQARRASKSICANIAEGFARRANSPADFRRFLVMATGSADEMRVWLRYARDLGYIADADWRRWREGYREVARMLQGLIRHTRGGGRDLSAGR